MPLSPTSDVNKMSAWGGGSMVLDVSMWSRGEPYTVVFSHHENATWIDIRDSGGNEVTLFFRSPQMVIDFCTRVYEILESEEFKKYAEEVK